MMTLLHPKDRLQSTILLPHMSPASGRVSPAFCRLPKDYGPCKEILLRFYYNPAIGTCQTFIYGGCHGNTNNFMTYRQCVNTCRLRLLGLSLPRPDAARSIAAPGRRLEDRSRVKPSICFLPVAPGPCQAYGPSFYYNAATGQPAGSQHSSKSDPAREPGRGAAGPAGPRPSADPSCGSRHRWAT
ncbi:hypothetical protein Y1Q_0016032 [Alligator mississippiensis]|uniref:BPTI/Kunitz inhibitor domain-containing protein n=1 Tax=Alligator mississippiensis TaxID=8496 RepID=A0A151N6X4_ALLMI|nr:hypothetical protein Y1Q_0016032 [Alligator mississippiensis]